MTEDYDVTTLDVRHPGWVVAGFGGLCLALIALVWSVTGRAIDPGPTPPRAPAVTPPAAARPGPTCAAWTKVSAARRNAEVAELWSAAFGSDFWGAPLLLDSARVAGYLDALCAPKANEQVRLVGALDDQFGDPAKGGQ